ncbi:hypothetical protein COV49_02575 [Candidatus Falkowbacteria bacterium CG11_big_fil_rev_8_21_14_0_20_39_10]|uniref:Uncharacterized protein n=1 Tax=Candidatus Falkowbacteria bacterium CG11_big_fil_rev_8_21_14_0_20_39_10 TaxID=1974570 RepID=A0A2M6K998_9BACT|nr:MAG: hypothetical protein COV49_02575 [Candidatus Falkowbacteria bacterium CG11_big_fil_rev_8_21_14_0_20_39_10]
MASNNDFGKKIRPFFRELEKNGTMGEFDVSHWLTEGTDAYKFAHTRLTAEERENLSIAVHASMLLEA